jgi:glc operon protein GlcG
MTTPGMKGTVAMALPERKKLTLEAARRIASAAEAEALRHEFTMCIAIVDDGGHLLCFERMDDTQLGSIEVAIAKARSALMFKRPTKALEDRLTGGWTPTLGLPGMVPVEGGLPLIVDDEIIGAIGISGGSAQQDGQIAAAGLAILA